MVFLTSYMAFKHNVQTKPLGTRPNSEETQRTNLTADVGSKKRIIGAPDVQCSFNTLEHCHRYVRDSMAWYTSSGGWIMLIVVLVGIALEVHLLTMKNHRQSRHVLHNGGFAERLLLSTGVSAIWRHVWRCNHSEPWCPREDTAVPYSAFTPRLSQ